MSLVSVDLDKKLIKDEVPLENIEEILGDEVESSKSLDVDLIQGVISSLDVVRKDNAANVDTLLDFTTKSEEILLGITSTWIELEKISTELLTPSLQGRMVPFSFSPITSSINAAKSAVSSGKDLVGNFADLLNPDTALEGLKSLLEFAMCPMPNFLGDLKGAVSDLKGSFQGLQIKENLKNSLIDFGIELLAGNNHVQSTLNLYNDLESIIAVNDTAIDIDLILNEVKSIMGTYGVDPTIMDMFNKKVEDKVAMSNVPFLSGSSVSVVSEKELRRRSGVDSKGRPVSTGNGGCSAVSRALNRVNNSYPKSNRFNSVDYSVGSNVRDPSVYDTLDEIYGLRETNDARLELNTIHSRTGYTSNDVISSTTSVVIENNRQLNESLKQLNTAHETDEANLQSVMINLSVSAAYMVGINKQQLEDIITTREGLKAIKKESKFYDISDSAKKGLGY